MLADFFKFLQENQGLTWVHWNMRDINYGFAALEHRFRVLGGSPTVLREGKKFDLARALVALYGPSYTEHPRLTTLTERNKMTKLDFLSGQAESDAFDKQEYIRLHQSTLRKVDIVANILERTANGTLKTSAKWRKRSGIHPRILVELIKEHWVYSAFAIAALVIGYIVWLADIL